jgi:NIPSNAP
VKRRTLLRSVSAAAFLRPLSAGTRQADQQGEPGPDTVYELRIYHVVPGKLDALLARFRDHTMKLFEQHRMKNVAYWTPVDEPQKGNTLIYILQHPSRAAAGANWKSFQDDPEWQKVKTKSEENGKLVEKIDSTFMSLTDFSPRLRQ